MLTRKSPLCQLQATSELMFNLLLSVCPVLDAIRVKGEPQDLRVLFI